MNGGTGDYWWEQQYEPSGSRRSGLACAGEHLGGCHGRLEWHHAIKQQRLKREFPHGALYLGDAPDDVRAEFATWMAASRLDPVVRSDEWGRTLDDILGDPRNRVWLCSHHHELVTNGRLKVELPESVWDFADEFGLRGMLENDLARAA